MPVATRHRELHEGSAGPSPPIWPWTDGSWSSTAAARNRSHEVGPGLAALGHQVEAIAGDVPTPTTGPRSCRGGRRARLAGPAGQQRQHASGPAPCPTLEPLPARRAAAGLRGQRRRPPGAGPVGAAPAAGGRRHRRVDLVRCRRRGLRGVGRVRVVQGRPGPAPPRPGRRGTRAARLPIRPGRHAHRHAPGRLPGRGHLRPARARVGGARHPPAARVGAPSGRYRVGDLVPS